MNVIIMSGVPGVGKSTYTNKLKKDYSIISTDSIRIELYGSLKNAHKQKKSNTETFKLANIRLKDNIKHKINTIFDATSLTQKRRKILYNQIKQYSNQFNTDVHVKIVQIVASYETCLQRNFSRPLDKQVNADVIKNMYISMQPPKINLDCDSFEIIGDLKGFIDEWKTLQSINDYHNSPYHSETISEHIYSTILLANEFKNIDNRFVDVATFHDLGKYVARKPKESVNKHTMFAKEKLNNHFDQFVGHQNVSAMYWTAFCFLNKGYLNDYDVFIQDAILWHMYQVEQKQIQYYNLNKDLPEFINFFHNNIDKPSAVVHEWTADYLNLIKK